MPVVSVAEVIAFAPEFGSAENDLITAKIAEAEARCPSKSWGSGAFQARGVLHKACRLLALSPWAREMKLVSDEGRTSWDVEIERMNRIAASGRGRLAGEP